MRGKKAKAIRRFAERTTVGMPERAYTLVEHPACHEDGHRRIHTGEVRLAPCTRRAAKQAKRALRDARRPELGMEKWGELYERLMRGTGDSASPAAVLAGAE